MRRVENCAGDTEGNGSEINKEKKEKRPRHREKLPLGSKNFLFYKARQLSIQPAAVG